MKENLFLLVLCVILLICSGISAILGLLKGKKIYGKETPSAIAQVLAQDMVTVYIIIPLFIISIFLLCKSSVYGNILVAGLSGYFLYTYASYSFYSYFNKIFLVNVAAFSSALFLFVLSTIELVHIMNSFTIPRIQLFLGGILLIIPGSLLLYMWLSQLIPATFKNKPVPILDLSQGKMTIQVKDLGIIAPTLLGFGFLLLFSTNASFTKAWLLILILTGTSMFAAVTAMAINETRSGYPDKPGIVIFSLLTLSYFLFFIWVVFSLKIS